MLKMFGGILGILGGLGGLGIAFLFLVIGSSDSVEAALGLGFFAAGIIAGACAAACFGLGIAILVSGGRFAGVLMLLPALAGTPFTYGVLLLAVIGGFLAAIFGETKPREESFENRKSRLEKEVQQRYGLQR